MRRISIAIALGVLGCAAPAPPPPPPPKPVVAPPPAEPLLPVGLPAGYVEMKAVRVVAVGDGQGALLLVDEPSNKMVPIFIGGTEAASIEARLNDTARPRPLTHDLLDHVLVELHAELVQVQIDDIHDQTYIGSIFIRTKGRVIRIDARPSDAVALAVGDHVPIYVARKVIETAGEDWDAVKQQLPPPAPPSDVRGT
ncbi:MAG TPA: bifunctional nuclease family protein [Kofleriaceae bacterium]|nr:bifunctional nuclease family protein [Kofleriaceae bacterium]